MAQPASSSSDKAMSAPRRGSAPLLLIFSLLILTFAAAAEASGDDGNPTTHLHFYFHEIFSSGPNSTVAQLSQVRSGISNSSFFGAMFVIDDMLREGADPSSLLIGRVQGLTVGSSLSDSGLLTMLNFVFTQGHYNGSTLQVSGRALLDKTLVVERPILGDTGLFRMARGYVLSKMVVSPDPQNRLILEFDAYVWH